MRRHAIDFVLQFTLQLACGGDKASSRHIDLSLRPACRSQSIPSSSAAVNAATAESVEDVRVADPKCSRGFTYVMYEANAWQLKFAKSGGLHQKLTDGFSTLSTILDAINSAKAKSTKRINPVNSETL